MRILLQSFLSLFLIVPLFSQFIEKAYYYNGEAIELSLKTDQLNVTFENTVTDNEAERILSQIGGAEFQSVLSFNNPAQRLLQLATYFSEADLSDLIAQLNKSPEIIAAAPVFIKNNVRSLVTNQFIVRFEDGTRLTEIEALNTGNGVSIIRKIAEQTYLLVTNKSTQMNGLQTANIYLDFDAVYWAHPNFSYINNEILNAVNDPYYPSQWAHVNTGQDVANNAPAGFPQSVKGFVDADMDVDLAWEALQGKGINPGENILIGVMDSGVELNHPDLKANIADPGKDFTGSQQNDGNDVEGHGTNVAGIIAAVANNGEGVAGIAYASKLLPVKMNNATDANIAEAFDYAWQSGADVLSNSWSGTNPVQVVTDAINRAKTQGRNGKGCVIVFSSGNEGHGTVSYPARLTDVIAVGAANMFNEKTNQASRDGNFAIGSNYGAELDLVAPTLVYTTNLEKGSGYADGPYNDAFNGTSGACPHVSATAALILSADPSLSSDQVQDILQRSTDPIERYMYDTKGWNKQVGYGRVNAYNAVRLALGSDGDLPNFSFSRIVSGTDTQARKITIDITDDSGIGKATLFYRTNYLGTVSAWKEIAPDGQSANTFTFLIPGQQWETQVEYYFYAEDGAGNFTTFPTLGDSKSAPQLVLFYHVAELEVKNYASKDVPKNWDTAYEMVFTSTLDIADDFLIVDADATVSVNGQIQDFAIIVEAPSGVSTTILSQNEGAEYSSTNTDDEAATAITDGQSPYRGSFQPDNGLFVFNGEQSKGQWLLRGWDAFWFNNGGSLTSWNLDLTRMLPNAVPVVKGIPNQTIDEGGSFTLIQLNNYVTDGNHTDAEMTWSSSGNNALIVTIDNNKNTATVQTPNNDWSGAETIRFTATDPGAASGSQDVVFTVNNINDAPVVADIPDQTVDEGNTFTTFDLDNYVSDVDNSDGEMSWSYSGNSELTVSIDNFNVVTVAIPNNEWAGSETITFKATDPGQLFDSDPAVFTVTAINDAPVVSDIPNQTIDEGATFTTITLDNYVGDPDNVDSEISWTYSGNSALSVAIDANRIATITIPI
jgi:subtilisin family serine protease